MTDFGTVERRQWEMLAKNENGEIEVRTLHYERKLPEVDPQELQEMFIRQAAPTRIIPSKRKIPTSDVETTVFLADAHYPYHSQRAIALAKIACRELNPTTICFLGDELDVTNFSKYETRKEWAGNLQSSIDALHEDIADFKADNPQAKLIQHESNHHVRLERKIREYNGDLVGLKRANAVRELGVLTLGFLLRHDDLGVEYVTGYPNAEYWHSDDIKSFHGTNAVSGGSTMLRTIKDQTVSCIQGHSHRAEIVYKTFRNGRNEKTIFGMNPGTLADFNQVPKDSYSTDSNNRAMPARVDWQGAIGVLFHNNEFASPHLLPITSQGIQIFGKTYKS